MPRYVILEHDYPSLHWDLMLEAGEVLRTWRLAEPPQPGRTVQATAVFDHRLMYLDYEGPISGNRGKVVRWDAGSFTWGADCPDRIVLFMNGQRLHGTAVLQREASGDWFFLVGDE